MPDFERVIRSLEMHTCSNSVQEAFVKGRHRGQDQARFQIVVITVAVSVVSVVVQLFHAGAFG